MLPVFFFFLYRKVLNSSFKTARENGTYSRGGLIFLFPTALVRIKLARYNTNFWKTLVSYLTE